MIKRSIRFWWQRMVRGWDDSDTWSLDGPTARFLAPRLRRFIEVVNGHPMDMSMEEWVTILEKMQFAFQTIADDTEGFRDWAEDEELNRRVDEGINLFSKYFFHLWW